MIPPCVVRNRKTLMEDNRRKTMAATIEAVSSRVSKERQKKIDKGMLAADVIKELGSEEAHKKKECMKEVRCDSRPRCCVALVLFHEILKSLENDPAAYPTLLSSYDTCLALIQDEDGDYFYTCI